MGDSLLSLVAGKPILESIIVDAECDQSTGICAYRGMETNSKGIIFQQGPFAGGSNNLVEFLAVVHALAHCKQYGLTCPVYTDSQTAMSWVTKKRINTTVIRSKKNEPLFQLIDRALIWLESNEQHNDVLKWNTKAWGENLADYGNKK